MTDKENVALYKVDNSFKDLSSS